MTDIREILASAHRRAQMMPIARTDDLRRALAARILFDLQAALRARPAKPSPIPEK